MTEVEHYRPPQLSDVPLPAITAIRVSRVPPAVPSPPATRNSPPPQRSKSSERPTVSDMTSESLGQWLFTDAELATSPSILDGIPQIEEQARRAKGVNFIIQAGILLKLPQLTLATASVFFHRFYMRKSMVPERGGLHHYNIAATSLFLATKTEENCRKTKEIVIAVAKVAQKNANMIIDEQSKEYWRWRDNILMTEELMLEYLTFDVVLESPYNYLGKFLGDLHIEDNKPIRNTAWAFLNDSQLTTMCLRMIPADIAIGAIYFAARHSKDHILDGEDGSPWWVRIGGTPERIGKAVSIMNEFYTDNPLKKADNMYTGSPNSSTEAEISSTRAAFNGATPRSDDGRNGRGNHHGHSPINGADSSNETSQSVENHDSLENGNSDVHLKEAANDPATHESTIGENGLLSLTSSSKRKSSEEHADEPSRKISKISGRELEEGEEEEEEGELEE